MGPPRRNGDGRLVLCCISINRSVRPTWRPRCRRDSSLTRGRRRNPPDLTDSDRFNAKVRQTQTSAALRSPVTLQPTTDWNQETFPPSPQQLVFEVVTAVDPEAWVQLTLAGTVRSPAGPATPGSPQTYTVETERAFFIDGFLCANRCDPDWRNALRFRSRVDVEAFAKAITVVDATSGKPIARPRLRRKTSPGDDHEYYEDENALTLEDAGYQAPPPDRRYTVSISSDLKSADGQALGYTWTGSVENWHRSAFTSFGDGQGVWEKGGGALLPFYARNFQDVTQWVVPVQPSELMGAVQRSRRQQLLRQPPAVAPRESWAWPPTGSNRTASTCRRRCRPGHRRGLGRRARRHCHPARQAL